jgi:3-deoxy-7-phosphoheptulonate synthase
MMSGRLFGLKTNDGILRIFVDALFDDIKQGNSHCHIILRGGKDGPNYSAAHVGAAVAELTKTGVTTKIMIDCSHGNSSKQHKNQMLVADDVVCDLGQSALSTKLTFR